MPDDDQASKIRDALLEQLQLQPKVGSQLGFALHQKWPELNMRSQYGGLRRFVHEFCAGSIEWRGKSGLDDIFGIPGQEPEAATRQSHTPLDPTYFRAWHAFTRPDYHDVAAINITGDLIVVDSKSAVPDGYKRVDGLTDENYREMARDFAKNQDASVASKLEAIIAKPKFWRDWLSALDGLALAPSWRRLRLQRLEQIVKTKLLAAGVQAGEANLIWLRLRAARKPETSESKAIRELPMAPYQISHLRDIAHLTIDRLSDTELREIRFPLGAMADAVTKFTSH
ncbi:MAG TPA: hypothetical protein VN380_07140 [Thermoanaerobaculia bacterium]|jgi:hypothetical protein|nr:hypothetical protein [Thermoanaerobaculia bacterium]